VKRRSSIDQFRGFSILLMILANYMNNVEIIPPFLKHAEDIGYTVIDLIAPMFVFAMGLTYGLSFRRRIQRDGAWNTYQHFLVRYLALLGLGYIITLVWQLSGIEPPTVNWGLLQALGAAGIIALPFIALPPLWRGLVGLGLLGIYQILLDQSWLASVIAAPHNGPWGALSWGAMLILATVAGDFYYEWNQKPRNFWLLSGGLTAAGLVLSIITPLSKHRASASYVLLSIGLSGLIFAAFDWLDRVKGVELPVLTAWGKNALLLYLFHYVIIGIYALPPIPGWYVEAPVWLVLVQIAVLLGVLSWVGVYLDRKKLYFVL
jgi:predicted acyltransferase